MKISENQINLILDNIDKISFLLDQNNDSEAYISMSELIYLLNLVLPEILNEKNDQIKIDKNKFMLTLTSALKAMEIKDNLLLSDILRYELKEILIGNIK